MVNSCLRRQGCVNIFLMISVQPNPNSVIMENVRMLIGDQEAQCTVANFPHVFKNRRINKTDD